MRALIIGSGIAGLSAALALRKVGIDAAVFERAPALGEVGAGISLWANALRTLDVLGVGDAVRHDAQPMTDGQLRTDEGRRTLTAYRAADLEQRFGLPTSVWMIHRAHLVDALAAALPPGVCQYGHTFADLEQDDGGVTAAFHDGRRERADLLIAADGVHSAVRAALHAAAPEPPPRYSGYTCWRGLCPADADLVPPGYLAEWWGYGRRFGITSLPGGNVYWWAIESTPPGGANPDEHAHLVRAFGAWSHPVPRLIQATSPDHVFRNDIIDRPPLRRWAHGRCVLIGDAAHATTPNLGQGGCIAIEDSVVLARHLRTASDIRGALRAFSAERYPRAATINRASWRLGRLGQLRARPLCAIRDACFALVPDAAVFRTMVKYAAFDAGGLA